MGPERSEPLLRVLGDSRDLGLLGPGALDRQVDHARGFAWAVREAQGGPDPRRVLDLGSGGGLPGLVLAFEWLGSRFTLLDAGAKRATFLRRAVERCGLEDRVVVLHIRAEEAGRDPVQRGEYDLVVARSFAPPAPTAECAAPFLVTGGLLVVSDRPDDEEGEERWSERGLAELGMGRPVTVRGEFGYLVIPQRSPCPSRYPRRVGVPVKRPLF